jgi:hypothetical protein
MGDILNIELQINPSFQNFLERDPLSRKDVESMIEEIDKVMFGADGVLSEAMRNNQSPSGEAWKPLSENYLAWKKRMLADGKEIASEIYPPKQVISQEIGIRTGKMKEMIESDRTGAKFRRVRINARNFIRGSGVCYEVFLKKIIYATYFDEQRKLFEWNDDAAKKIEKVVNKYIKAIAQKFNSSGGRGRFKLSVGVEE